MGFKPRKSNIAALCLVIAFFAAIIAFSGITNALPQIQVINANPAVSAEIAQNIPAPTPTPPATPTSGYERCKTDGIFCGICDDAKDIPSECVLVNARAFKRSICYTSKIYPPIVTQRIPNGLATGLGIPEPTQNPNSLNYKVVRYIGYYSWCDARIKIENVNPVPFADRASIHFSFTTTTDAKATVKITGKNTGTAKTYAEQNAKNSHWTDFNALPADEYSYEISACNQLQYCNSATGSVTLSYVSKSVDIPNIVSPQPNQAFGFEAQPIQAQLVITGSYANYSTQIILNGQAIATKECLNNTLCTANLPLLAVGKHLLIVNASYEGIYAAKSISFNVTQAVPALALYVNGLNADQTIGQGETAELNATLSIAGDVAIYENGSLAAQGQSPLLADRVYASAGTINLTAYYPGNQNYSAATATHWLTVQQITNPGVEVPVISTPENKSYEYQADQPLTLSFKATGTFSTYQSKYVLDGNTVSIGNALNNTLKSVALPVLAAGQHSIKVNASNAGYSNESGTVYFTVAPSTPALTLAVSTSNAVYGTQTTAQCASSAPQASAVLKRNGTAVANPETAVLAAGDYEYSCDSAATQNYSAATTTPKTLTITKASTLTTLSINGAEADATITYGDALNAQASTNWSTATLLLNGTGVANPFTQPLAAGYYNFTATNAGDSNHSPSSATHFLAVSKAAPVLTLAITPSSSVGYGTQTTAQCTSSTPQAAPALKRDSNPVSNPETATLAVGSYQYSCDSAETQNYSAATATPQTLSVGSIPTATTLLINGADSDATVTYGATVTAQASTSWGTATLLLNGSAITSPFSQQLAAGYYNFTAQNAGDENHSPSTATHFVAVNKAAPTLTLTINPSATVNYGTQTTAQCTSNAPQVTPVLKRDSIAVANPETLTLGGGAYQYSCDSAAAQNYSAATAAPQTLTVNKAPTTLTLYINGSDADAAMAQGSTANLTAVLSPAAAGSITLYVNGSQYAAGASPLTNLSTFPQLGSYSATASFAANQNYSASNAAHWLTISDVTPPSITFLAPTPPDAANLSTDNATINATLSESGTARLEWKYPNATAANYSMTFAGGAFNKNMTFLGNGTHQYRVWANDSAGNMNATQWRSLTIPPFVKIHTFPEGTINTMAVFKNQLYVGTYANGSIYRSSDGVNWQLVFNGSNYPLPFGAVWAFEKFNNGSGEALYAAMGGIFAADTSQGQAVIFKSYDGAAWNVVINMTFMGQTQVSDLEAYNNTLYAITSNSTAGYVVYTTNDADWYPSIDAWPGMALAAKSTGLYAAFDSDSICWLNWSDMTWRWKTGFIQSIIRSITVYNDKVYFAGGKKVNSISNDLSSNQTVLTTTDTGFNNLFASPSNLYAGSGNSLGAILRTPDGTAWGNIFSGEQNRSRGFVSYNATGDWRLYAGIGGPNWFTVNGGQAHLYRATFAS